MAEPDEQGAGASKGRNPQGKFLNAAGTHDRWVKGASGCPHFLRRAPKRELATYLLEIRQIRLRLVRPEEVRSPPARVHGLGRIQAKRVETRMEILHQLLEEQHLKQHSVTSKDYPWLASEIAERTCQSMDRSTLYLEPYRSIIAGRKLSWESEEDRALRKLRRETRDYLQRQIAYERRLIRTAERQRHERIFGASIPTEVESGQEHAQ